MKKEEIQSSFETWLQSEKGIDVNSYSIYKAAAIESAQQFSNSTYNEIPFQDYYAKEEHNNLMLETWKHTVELMLSHTDSSITFKNVKLSDYRATKDELLNQLQNIDYEK